MDTDHGGNKTTKNLDTEITGSELGHRWCENTWKYDKLRKNEEKQTTNLDTEIKGSELGHRWCENKGHLSRRSEQKT